jgi:O-antigen ligase
MKNSDSTTSGETAGPEERRDAYLGWLTVILAASVVLYRPWIPLASTLILLVWVLGGGLRQHIALLRTHRLTLAIVAFLALNIASLAWTSDPASGFRYLTKYHYLLLIPVLATSLRPAFRRSILKTFSIAAVLSAIASFAVLVSGLRIGDAHPGNPSVFMAHLDSSLLLALAAVFIISFVVYCDTSLKIRAVWMCCFVVVTGGLAINIGRGGQLAFICGLFALAVFWARQRSLRAVFSAIAAVVFCAATLWLSSPRLQTRIAESQADLTAALTEQKYSGSLGGRVAATIVAREIVREHPILGTGIGANMAAFRVLLDSEFKGLKPAVYWYRHFHSQYTQIATELGLVGLLALAWIFWELFRGPYTDPQTGAIALILGVVYLVGFIGEPYFHKQIPLVTFALFAGLVSSETLDGERSTLER